MKKTLPKKLLSYLLTLAMAVSMLPAAPLAASAADYSLMPAVTEKYTTETDGSTAFTESGLTFSVTGGYLHVEQTADWGFDDDYYVDNSDHPLPGAGVVGSFKCTTSDFTVHSLKLITLNASVLIEQYNNILIRGKLDGATVFTHTVPYDSINTTSANNYYTIIDLSSYSSDVIDELVFEVESYGTNDIRYLMIDDFSFSQVVANTAPTVTTGAATDVAQTTATANGNITDLGSPDPTQHGFVWDTEANPTVALETRTEQGAASSTGAFTGSLTGLAADTTYHVRAYATNTAGTSYGDDITFTTQAAADTWDGETDTAWYSAGASSFTIYTAEELAGLASIVNAGTDNFSGDTIALAADLDLDNRQWTPIGNTNELTGTVFSGTFNGGGHIILNLTVGASATPATYDNSGLFGYINGGTVNGLGLENVLIFATGMMNTGGMAGITAEGSISDCYVTGHISGGLTAGGLTAELRNSSVSNCYTAGSVQSGESDSQAGGMFGLAQVTHGSSSIQNCYTTSSVSSSYSGGFVGGLSGNFTISNCYAAGNVTGSDSIYSGGFIAYRMDEAGSRTNCYYNSSATQFVGGVQQTKGVGDGFDDITARTSAEMKAADFVTDDLNSGSSGWTSDAENYNQGYPVRSSLVTVSSTLNQVTYDENGATSGVIPTDTGAYPGEISITLAANTGALGKDGYTFGGWNTLANGLGTPYDACGSYTITEDVTLYAEWMPEASAAPWDGTVASAFAGGDGTSGNPYKIATGEQLAYMADRVNNANATYGNKYYILTADIDLNGSAHEWTPIGNADSLDGTVFSGSFDGDGYKIRNLAIGSSGSPNASFPNAGLLGYVYRGSVIDVRVLDVAVYSAGANAGGLVGYWNGTSGIATSITNCCTTGIVSGGVVSTGGLIGKADYCAVSKCCSTCTVTGGTTSPAGGLVGLSGSTGSVTSCFATGNVTSTGENSCAGGLVGLMGNSITNCYAAGSASAVYSGGLVGYADTGTVTGSYYNCTVNTLGIGAGSWTVSATAITSADMKLPPFVTSLNDGYSGTWETVVGANQGYPVLIAVPMEVIFAAPTVTTSAATYVTQTTATGNGSLTGLGYPNPTSYGVCWNTSGDPTISDSVKDLGAASSTGAYTAAITGLTAGTTYHVRAYATNSEGTSYGDDVTFTTTASAAASLTDVTWVTASTYTCGIEMSSSARMVTISVDTGYFTVPSLGSSGLTFLYGTDGTSQIGSYGSTTHYSSAVFSFTNVTDAENLLSDIVYAADGALQQKITVTVSTVSPQGSDIYFEGHFYRYVSTPVNWIGAVLAAHGTTDPYFGGKGYIATATSQAENSILLKLVDNYGGGSDHWNDAWMGGLWQRNTGTVASPEIVRGTDGNEITYADLLGATALERQNMLVRYTNIYTDFIAGDTSTYIYENPGTVRYYWIDGPEAGQEIANNTADFAPWHVGEPNSGDFVYIGWEGAYWDDLGSYTDTKSGYIVEFSGFDGGSTAGIVANDTKTVTINRAPTGISLSATAVSENVAANTTIGTLSTTDSDVGDTFTYTLVSGTGDTDNASFIIDGDALKLTLSPNYETKSSYALRIETKDAAGATFSKAFTVTVTDLNEEPTITSGASANFAENASGTAYTAAALDPDAGTTLTWSITGGADNAKFTVNASTGALAFVSSPDYESPADADGSNTYVVTLRVSDGTLMDEKTVTVTVTDVNEEPAVTSAAAADFAENGSGTAYSAQASDPDAGDILTWSISGTDAGSFNVNPSTGAVTFKTVPDFESPADANSDNVYSITVTVSDDGGSPLTASENVAITVTNVSEAPTVTAVGKTSGFTQGDAVGADLFGTVTTDVIDGGQTFTGAVLTVTDAFDAAEYLTVSGTDIQLSNGTSGTLTGGAFSVSVTGGTATVTLTGMSFDNAAMASLIDGITYKSTGTASVTQGPRVVTLTQVSDSGTVSNTAELSIAATVTVARLASAVQSTVKAVPAEILADGTAVSTVTVTLKDANGNPVAGKTVTLAQGTGSSAIDPASAVTGADGIAEFSVKGLTLETVAYTATDSTDSVTVSETASVTFTLPTYAVTVRTKLDGALYDMTSVALKSGTASLAASKTAAGTYTATAANGTYKVYVNGIYTGSDVTVLYAPEEAVVNFYTVTFNSVGGSAVSAQTVIEGSKAAIPAVPTKTGSTFAGWYGDAGYGSVWNFSTGTVTEPKTLFAKWSAVPTYTVTYEAGGATSGSVPTDTTAYETGAQVTVKNNLGSLAKTENTFAGWSDGETVYAPGAPFVIEGNVTLTALWTPVVRTYSVTYSNHYEEGGTYATQSGIVYGARLTAPAAPTREGCSFIGWYKDPTCGTAWNFTADTVTRDAMLYAKWAQNTHSVGGKVEDDNTPAQPVSGAAVSVVQGNVLFAETVTDDGGSFTLTGIPDGIYNLVVTKGSQTVTVCVEISGEDKPVGTVTLPAGNKNSVLEVGGSGTPDVVVDNLQDVFEDEDVFTPEDEENVADEGATVEIRLTVQKNDASQDKTVVLASMTSGGYTTGMILDVDMTKTVTSSSGAIVGASQVKAVEGLIKLIIPLPLELQGKTNYVVTRAHDYEDGRGVVVDRITETPDPDDNERIVVSEDKTQLTLYVKYFSTYAIGFTAPSSGSSDSTSSGYIITASAGAGGSIAPIGKTSVARGSSKTYAVTPDEGYCVSDVLVDGVSVGALISYTFTDVRKAHTIEATFVKNEGLPYYVGEDGSAAFIGFAAKKDGVMKYIAPAGVTVLFKENPKRFEDTAAHWAKSYIDFVTEREIFMGASDNIFAPNEGMTRAMFAAVIGRLCERSYGEIETSGARTFKDCNYSAFYAKYVEWAAKEGIIEGYGDGRFGPNDAVTREQMAAILYRFADYLGMLPEEIDTALGYTDAEAISSWASSAALYCQGAKIITGRDGGAFVPQGLATRAEVAIILERFIENSVD